MADVLISAWEGNDMSSLYSSWVFHPPPLFTPFLPKDVKELTQDVKELTKDLFNKNNPAKIKASMSITFLSWHKMKT